MNAVRESRLTPEATDVAGAATIAGCSESTIKRAAAWGHLKSHVLGNRRRFFVRDVRAWLAWIEEESIAGRPVNYRGKDAPPTPRMAVPCPQGRRAARKDHAGGAA